MKAIGIVDRIRNCVSFTGIPVKLILQYCIGKAVQNISVLCKATDMNTLRTQIIVITRVISKFYDEKKVKFVNPWSNLVVLL